MKSTNYQNNPIMINIEDSTPNEKHEGQVSELYSSVTGNRAGEGGTIY